MMKVKRFNNLWTMGLILCAGLLLVIYIAKLFFPNFVIEISHTENILKIGHYIDNHKWAWYLATFIVTFVSYYLICCACCKAKILKIKELLMIAITIVILFLIKEFLPSQYTSTNISSMILLPFLMKGNFKATTIVFVATNFLQTMSLEIRGLSLLIADFNYATFLILTIDYYIVCLLFYFLFNYERENLYGSTKYVGIR